MSIERRVIVVRGTVQGVGFRPFVYGLAVRLGLGGFVRNTAGVVVIEAEGGAESLDQFISALVSERPVLARVNEVTWTAAAVRGEHGFLIEGSLDRGDSAESVVIAPDAAVCADCLRELFDPNDRRFGYPFLNCTNCGPRLTIVTGTPYDRARTTMAVFAMCGACRAEYEDPTNRRFHAQPTACARCGPALRAMDAKGQLLSVPDPLGWFAEKLRNGQIGAMKGLGGYHLVCDATSGRAVAELRRRKQRDEKPFAIMMTDLAAVESICVVDAMERELLISRQRPIVLVKKRSGTRLSELLAPGNPLLGVMLPYTPLHHLLLRTMNGLPLVMTSANRSDEPIAFEEPQVFRQLERIANFYLTHNRPIHVRCDDSVTRSVDGVELPIRRSRGYAPQPIGLPVDCSEPILAVGGQLKNTFALGRKRQAVVSHHNGDLDHFQAYQQFVSDIEMYERLFETHPKIVAHDLHPDYASTRYAQSLSRRLFGVQHHHAHMASCMVEHGLNERVIGVTFDGTGFGTDGTVWGGEFLIGDFSGFARAAHLRYVCMPGGDRAIREPWRMALSHLVDAELDFGILRDRVSPLALKAVDQMIRRGFNSPMTSSAGRLFDAVASIAGIRDVASYEGQAAVELEWAATGDGDRSSYSFEISIEANQPMVVDTRPLMRSVLRDSNQKVKPATIARRFHSTVVNVICDVCARLREASGLNAVVLSGGVFMNALLTHEACQRLRADHFRVYRHQQVPTNDGGLSLGQLAIAACQLSR